MKKLNFKRLSLILCCIIFIIFIVFYLINIVKLNTLKKANIGYLSLNSKNIKNIAINTSRVASTSLVKTKKLQSYVEIGCLELPVQGSTGYASVKMNLMSTPNSNSGIVTTFSARNWF